MVLYAQTFPTSARRGPLQVKRGSRRYRWWLVIALFEALFVLCRANVQQGFSLDDPLVWLAGLSPFVVAVCGQRFFDWQPRTYLQTWLAALAAFFAMRAFDLGHFIEYPLFVRFDEGFVRYFLCSAAYVLIGAGLLLVLSSRSLTGARNYIAKLAIAVPVSSVTLTIALFLAG